jgi:DNA-binding XRE family transcriptional regulator
MPIKRTVPCVCKACGRDFLAFRNSAGFYCSQSCSGAARIIPVSERFWSKVDKNGPTPDPSIYPDIGSCWCRLGVAAPMRRPWAFLFNGLSKDAHIVAYILTTGHEPPPETPEITHLCDGGNIGCVRPSHLMPDTHAGNMAQMAARQRSNIGERNPSARVSVADVKVIRQRRANGETQANIARFYEVDPATISLIVSGKTWPSVT